MSSKETVTLEISKELLTKLQWAMPSGNDPVSKIEYLMTQRIEDGEKREGVKYPSDRLPGHEFDNMSLKS